MASLNYHFENEWDLAQYVYDNYAAITGRPQSEAFDEGDFPSAIYKFVEDTGWDWDLFQDAWTMM